MWIELLPSIILHHLDVFGLIIIGLLVEKHYVSRPAIFANSIAVNIHVWRMGVSPEWLIWYANIGVIVGIIAIFTYVAKKRPGRHYTIASNLYSSAVVAVIILITIF